jgi:hypothetical protein
MAQTKRKRRRKHRGTQGGRIDSRPARGRPRNRAEAKARARGRGAKKGPQARGPKPPSWGSALGKGLLAAALFFAGLVFLFKEPAGATALISLALVGFYVPMAYYVDGFFYRRARRKEEQERLAKSARKDQGQTSED